MSDQEQMENVAVEAITQEEVPAKKARRSKKKTEGVVKQKKPTLKSQYGLLPESNSAKIIRGVCQREYQSGNIPFVPKIARTARIAITDRVAARVIKQLENSATATRHRGAKTITEADQLLADNWN